MLAAAFASVALVPAPVLDPLALISSKAAQPTCLRPYLTPCKNGGLETATLAMVRANVPACVRMWRLVVAGVQRTVLLVLPHGCRS